MARSTFSDRVLAWYDQHGRTQLPWQKNVTPYRVWVSEIMLQQTQVSTAIPYYRAFMKRFPSVKQLAEAAVDDVLHHWSGLGYYARARNLHEAAKIIHTKYAGRLPDDPQVLSDLPGIGLSTAGAIVSLAYQKRAVILDGNVKRVLARHFLLTGVPSGKNEQQFWQCAERHTPSERVHHYTQAIMDLGATLCTPRQPACPHCPLKRSCKARQTDRIGEFPQRPQRQVLPLRQVQMLLLLNPRGEVYLQQRPPKGIWGGLWSLPELPVEESAKAWCRNVLGTPVKSIQAMEPLEHVFSHFRLQIKPLRVQLGRSPSGAAMARMGDCLWYKVGAAGPENPRKGLAAPVSKLLQGLHELPFTRVQTPEL